MYKVVCAKNNVAIATYKTYHEASVWALYHTNRTGIFHRVM